MQEIETRALGGVCGRMQKQPVRAYIICKQYASVLASDLRPPAKAVWKVAGPTRQVLTNVCYCKGTQRQPNSSL